MRNMTADSHKTSEDLMRFTFIRRLSSDSRNLKQHVCRCFQFSAHLNEMMQTLRACVDKTWNSSHPLVENLCSSPFRKTVSLNLKMLNSYSQSHRLKHKQRKMRPLNLPIRANHSFRFLDGILSSNQILRMFLCPLTDSRLKHSAQDL